MMSCRRYLFIPVILALAASAVSCIKDPYEARYMPYAGSDHILIDPVVDGDWVPVKSAWDPADNAALRAGGFGVYAFYTGSEEFSSSKLNSEYTEFGRVYDNRRFYYDEGQSKWLYDGLDEYWPTAAGKHLSFFAYAPYSVWSSSVTYDGRVPSIPYTVAPDLTVSSLQAQRDLLWGTNSTGVPHKDIQAGDLATAGVVDMHFRHALSKLHFTIAGLESDVGQREIRNEDHADVYDDWPSDSEYEEEEPVYTILGPEGVSTAWVGSPARQGSLLSGDYTQTARKTWRFTLSKTTVESQSRQRSKSRTEVVEIDGKKYLVESLTIRGLNRTGTLLLDNTTAREPEWSGRAAFPGPGADYTLNASGALTTSLKYIQNASDASFFDPDTGILADPTEMLSGYPLSVIPRATGSSPVELVITYHALDVAGNRETPLSCEVTETRTRTRTETWVYTTTTETLVSWNRGFSLTDTNNRPNKDTGVDYPVPSTPAVASDVWGERNEFNRTNWNTEIDDPNWIRGESELTGVQISDTPTSLQGSLAGIFEGGKSYTVNLLLSGDRVELSVTPRPWTLEEQAFEYLDTKNEVIQHLTYDGSTVDYADAAGNVYINTRMARFFFQLRQGKYVSWQAILVGDSAFGFTDASGNFLREGGKLVSSVGGTINEAVTNNIYIRALDDTATVTSRAKLRIYYLDANGHATAALDLVNMDGVTEWTIVQNGN